MHEAVLGSNSSGVKAKCPQSLRSMEQERAIGATIGEQVVPFTHCCLMSRATVRVYIHIYVLCVPNARKATMPPLPLYTIMKFHKVMYYLWDG